MTAQLAIGAGEQRRDARIPTRIEGGLGTGAEDGATRVGGTILDLSRFGFRIEPEAPLAMDSVVWLHLADRDPLMACVVWTDGASFGCRFAAPLRDDALARLLTA